MHTLHNFVQKEVTSLLALQKNNNKSGWGIAHALHLHLTTLADKLQMLAQRKLESQSASGTIGCGDSASVHQNGVLNDGEPEACAAFLARAPFVDTIKAVEEVRKMFGRNAPAVVFDSDATRLLCVFE